jgi:hypothetical protein
LDNIGNRTRPDFVELQQKLHYSVWSEGEAALYANAPKYDIFVEWYGGERLDFDQ